ncbi:MAG: ABC transporter substrate-binding protein [Patescibacteria group bacterium]
MRWRIPKSERLLKVINSFSIAEKAIFYLVVVIFITSSVILLWKVNQHFLVEFPARGGELKEGIVGSPRFINPILATNDADRDMTALIYSGLMKSSPEGKLVPDLAESYTVSKDGLIYSFKLKDNVYFHDGRKVTADDVEFTINKTQDSALKSPKRANWDGIKVNKKNDREIEFILKQPYSPFLENTTLGILPKHIWTNFDNDQFSFSLFNIEPIGSGPYKIKTVKKNSYGIPTYYTLTSFNKYALGEPYIKNLIINFYQNEKSLTEDFQGGNIESMNTVSSQNAETLKNEKDLQIVRAPLSRIFGVFFNQNQSPVLMNKEVREALNAAVDKDGIVNEVLNGYGIKINSPMPPELAANSTEPEEQKENADEKIKKASSLLEKGGWKMNAKDKVLEKKTKISTEQLRFAISTANTPELKKVAELIKETWEKLGAKVEVKIFEPGDLNQNIRARKYDALLFGEIIGRDLDLFAFWHSSQRKDPGLNIALYANSKADKLLEDARKIENKSDRMEKYKQFEAEIEKDTPVVFLYSPDFIYIIPAKVRGYSIGQIITPAERFLNVNDWYVNTGKVWKIFAGNRRVE